MRRPILLAVLALFATAAFAQEATLDMRPKHSSTLDGSLGITKGHGTGFDMTLGGTAVKDRVWFFASAERTQPMFASATPVTSDIRTIDAKAIANIGDRQNLAATFASATAPALAQPLSVPSNFLSMHYTATVTSNSFFTMDFSESRR